MVTAVPTALSPLSRKGRIASSAAFSMARIMTGVASTFGRMGSLNRLARCSGRTRRVNTPLVPTGMGFMECACPDSGARPGRSEPRHRRVRMLHLGRAHEAMADQLAPSLEIVGAAEIDGVILDAAPFHEQTVALRFLDRSVQLHAGAAACALENRHGFFHARLEFRFEPRPDLDLRDFQYHDARSFRVPQLFRGTPPIRSLAARKCDVSN